MKTIFYSTEVDNAINKLVKVVKDKPGLYILKLTKANNKRSLSQNAYYWGVVVKIISDHTGFTSNEVHQELAKMFLGYEKSGKSFTQSTTELDTLEFELYLDRSRKWAWNEMELTIPMPNEVTEDMFDELEKL